MIKKNDDSTKQGVWTITSDMNILRKNLLDLFCQLAYRDGDFVLSSGQKSSYYINGKQVTLHAEGALLISRLLLSLLPINTDAVAGLELGAVPIVSSVSVISALENRPIPGLIIRKEVKEHGTKAYIEGPTLPSWSRVVVLEDVVTTGKSAMRAVNHLRDSCYVVDTVISLIDRKQGGKDLYQSKGLDFFALFDIEEIKERYKELENFK
ncbi:Orotate phosphoribosyltransferase [Richelia intracellularis HH01]|uniref:Orotate phosphoribosyltransferase n=2 Tax=Richelia TaxID=98443 RepID=M1X044_9NOST|nr:orotate phosphoribosyltransferase [Richelia intracellularis]CCH67273.1 Orotate phosphoribosyltransferase [Richelia intracellularis HH01]